MCMYIVLEWVVWTGKSTQSDLLVEYLRESQEKEVVFVREPWWTEISEAIRTLVQWTDFSEQMDPLTDIYLYASARAQLLMSVVKPALERWAIVVSDRCFCSSLAIQWVAQWASLELVREVNRPLLTWCFPDLVLFLDLDVDVWLQRIFDADGDKFEKRAASFSHKIYKWYEMLFDFAPTRSCFSRIDASWWSDQVHERIRIQLATIYL